jgi:hypothetical protein
MRAKQELQGDAPAIRIGGLVKDYGRVRALAGIDLEVRRGEVFGFLGPNGAVYAGLAIAVAGVVGRPGPVLALGLGLALVGYLVAALFPLSDVLDAWAWLSPWGLGARRRPALPSHRARPVRGTRGRDGRPAPRRLRCVRQAGRASA